MPSVIQMRLDEQSLTEPEPSEGGAWLSYSVDTGRVYRHVRRRNGSIATTGQPRSSRTDDLAADFDLSWLRSPRESRLWSIDSSALRVADLFSGCGGMSLGIEESCRALKTKCDFVFAAELDPVKAGVYRANFPAADVRPGPVEATLNGEWGAAPTVNERGLMSSLGRVDVLLGGPPCQGHSDLNNHTRRDDARNGLVMRMARFAELFRPKFVIVENVEGVRHDKHRAVSKAASCLRSLGYMIKELLVPCIRLGVPQSRRRYMLVAVMHEHDGGLADFTDLEVAPRTVEWAIGDLVACMSDGVFDTSAKHSAENARRMRYLFDRDLYDLPNAERPACHRLKIHSYNSVYGRMRWDEPAPTITTGFGSTGQGRFVHPLSPRTLTPHEAARLQTYPDFFEFGEPGRTQLQKMIGNSVPPLAMLALGLALFR